ncbi:MAG: MerR family transcriptional regulator [Salinivirgaceae bacterium]|nr:MerR family transcriptional regulator [Salinivirgaceae bacterium]MDD4747614.1 MerR family transcriptional regulator [Salinivirgaceae bacterium]MDY0280457.1 MerR family transcriptional regulator [Salinivirgaceae bacterium]
MPYKEDKIIKLYYSISEVAEMFGVNTSKIRYYENTFDILKPKKNKKGNRQFTIEDIDNLKIIFHLIDEEGMTIKGVINKLKESKNEIATTIQVIDRLKSIREILIEIKEEL